MIVLAPDALELALPDEADRVSFARDPVAYEGPLAGALAGLERVRRETTLLVAGDMPGVSAALLTLMAGHATGLARNAVVLTDEGDRRPIPAVLAVAPALALARKLLESGERRLRALVEGLEAEGLPEPVWSVVDPDGAWRRDVDLPGDLPTRRG